jgi:hypothetical protein
MIYYYYYYDYHHHHLRGFMAFLKGAARKSRILKVRNEVEKCGSNTILERMESNVRIVWTCIKCGG